MKLLASLLALPLLIAAAPAARNWSATVTARPDGAWVIGNPAARVKLVEWGSYTCPHCAHFSAESRAALEGQMIRSGSTSLEVRHLIRDPLDLAAVAIARCGGPRGFVRRHHAIFDGQATWMKAGGDYIQANGPTLQALDRPVAFRRVADAAGLTAIGRASGLTPAQLATCLSPAGFEAATKLGDPPADVNSTPTFYVNGAIVPNVGWAGLAPALTAAGAR